MPSPFPGMNPYIERSFVWHDFHEHFVPLAAQLLNRQILPHYFARIDEHVFLHELSAEERRLVGKADVAVAPGVSGSAAAAVGASEAPAQVVLEAPVIDEERLSFVEIRDRENRGVISVIELLSPTNKNPGPDRTQYLTKRHHYLNSAVHLVEIDLLRGGPRMPMTGLPACDYCVMVSRAPERPKAGIWPLQLPDPLPIIPVLADRGARRAPGPTRDGKSHL